MDLHGKVASVYARAVLEAAGSTDNAKKLAVELKDVASVIDGHPQLKLVLTSRAYSESFRKAVLEDLFKVVKVSDLAQRAVKVVSENKRLNALSAVAGKLSELLLTKESIVPISVASSSGLGGDEKKQIETRFSKILGKPVEASYEVKPNLIGGVRVTAGGKTYDGTISGWLNRFEEILVGGNI